MAEFYDSYLGYHDKGYSPQVISPDRVGGIRTSSQYSRSMRISSSRTNSRAFVRGRNNYDEEGYGGEGDDDGPLELSMIRVKVVFLYILVNNFFKTLFC